MMFQTLHPHNQPAVPISPSTVLSSPSRPHLYQHVGCVVQTHDQSSHSGHVVHVGKCDEGDRRHVVKEHDQEILETQLYQNKGHTTTECTFKMGSWLWGVTACRANPELRVQYSNVVQVKGNCVHTLWPWKFCVFKMTRPLLLTNIN